MTGLFDRWRGGTQPAVSEPEAPAAVGLQLWLDGQGSVQRLSGPLRTLLALPFKGGGRVQDYLERHSWLVLEGQPADWQGQPLDLDFRTATGNPLCTRGWVMRQGDGWLLQLFDIGGDGILTPADADFNVRVDDGAVGFLHDGFGGGFLGGGL